VPKSSDLAAFLAEVRLFSHLTLRDREALAASMREQALRKGQVLFRNGDPGEEMFLIRNGTVLISKPVKVTVDQVLARMGAGDFFGEMSLFDRAPRSATVQGETDVRLVVLSRESLRELTATSPHAAAAFFEALVHVFIERLRASGELVAEVTRWGLEATGLDVDPR
jgi:CRP-like cAMP-binding protein